MSTQATISTGAAESGCRPARSRRPVPVGEGARLLVHLADGRLHSLVTDHDEVPGLGVGAEGPWIAAVRT